MDDRTLTPRFPILEKHLNPYHTLQGGFLASTLDNTFEPLSMLVALPNVTRHLEVTYSEPFPPPWVSSPSRPHINPETASVCPLELTPGILKEITSPGPRPPTGSSVITQMPGKFHPPAFPEELHHD